MPRNATKKTNKNAKRLPVLIKLTNINNNNKKKKVNSNQNSNNSSDNGSKNRKNNNSNTTIKNTKKKNKQIKKVIVNATFTRLNKIDDNCDADISISTTKSTRSTPQKSLATSKEHPLNSLEKQFSRHSSQQKHILKYFSKNLKHLKSIKLDNVKEVELKSEQKPLLNIVNNVLNDDDVNNKIIDNCDNSSNSIKENDICKTEVNFTSKTETKKTILPSSPILPSFNSSISSLYPTVIEKSESFQYNDNKHQQRKNILNKKNKYMKLHSSYSNNNNNITAVGDTLKHKLQQNTINSNSNKIIHTITKSKCNGNSNKQHKQSKQTKKESTTETSNQSQEVKARLATLRTRRKVLQQEKQPSDKTEQTLKKISCCLATNLSPSPVISDTCKKSDSIEVSDILRSQTGKGFIKRVPPILDDATFNLIETLSDNEVKKTNNKRKRSTNAALLGLALLHQPRPKRILANPPTSLTSEISITTIPGAAIVTSSVDKSEQKKTIDNFLKPLPIDTANTNLKKRARIMSLYERPFQTTNDGRGSVVSNGYMTSSRSSASSGGVTGGALVMNDTNETQEMASQYYLPGTSVSGITSNSNPSLVGNGSAINHAPTMGTLCNIGNTCYLNSVVYTLRFAPQFLHNLHHLLADLNALQQNIARARAKSSSLGRGINTLQMENIRSWSSKDLASMEQYGSGTIANISAATVDGHISNSTALIQVTQKSSHQLLTEKLHDLYQSLHRNEINESAEPHHADTLLHAIQDVSSIFEGNQQQDAHEFLMCLLNSIRETSQTLIKAIAECPDVILNGYISNPDEIERDLIKSHSSGGSGGVGVGGNNSNNSNNLGSSTLSSLTSSKTSSFFSRKSKRKDDGKSSKNSRLQSPLKDALVSSNTGATTTANSLFYLNTYDLNSTTSSSSTCPVSGTTIAGVSCANTSASGAVVTSPLNSSSHLSGGSCGGGDEPAASTAVALILKDKELLEGKIRELGLDFFNEDFEGITVSTTKCLSCETITEQKETMIDIAVPVPQAGYESNEFMDRPSSFIQNSCITREYFRNENKYRCEQCCGYTEAIRSISYEILPRLLIIQLSRFSGGMEKINSYIPTSFTLQCFCSKCCALSDANKLHIYKLYSVITHVGATMSVGHYIAYTCSLDWANEYISCPKEQRRRASQERNLGAAGNGSVGVTGSNNCTQLTASSVLGSSSNSFMKMKMKFGRNKASSSGDMSKNVKQLNGLNSTSKAITNGIGKLTMNNFSSSNSGGCGVGGGSITPQCPVTCHSINCCAMRLTAQQQLQYQSANSSTSDFSEESSQYSNGPGYNNSANYNNNIHHIYTTSTNTSGYGSTGRGSNKVSYGTQSTCNEPIWYMCDDDKIKAMTQREFEELLSPARKITITPYLLFYARYNLQSTSPKSVIASSSSPGPATTSSPQTSWSNESLQSSGHSVQSSSMRM